MIRNILYSLLLHITLFTLLYFSFNFSAPIEIEKTNKITVDFATLSTNSDVKNPSIKPAEVKPEAPKELSKIKPIKKKPVEKPVKKLPKAEPKKEQPKIIPKKINPEKKEIKDKINKSEKPDYKPTPQKPKAEKIEEKNKKPEVKEEIKKELPIKNEKVEKAPTPPKTTQEKNIESEANKNQYDFTENSIEGLNLLARDKFNIKNQIKRCYKKALAQSGTTRTVVNAHILITKDGFIDLSSVIIKDFQKYDDPTQTDFHQAVDVALQALKFCSPIRNLPKDKYEVWKTIDLQFDEE